MDVDCSALTTEHRVGHVGAVIGIGITHAEDTSLTGPHAIEVDLDLLVLRHVKAHLGRKCGALDGRKIGNESVALDRLAVSEIDDKFVELQIGGLVLMNLAVPRVFNASDGAVLDLDVPCIQLLLPALVLGRCSSFAFGGLGTVDKGNYVTEQGVDFHYTVEYIGNAAENTERLITVLVAVAPGTPEDALTPGFSQTGGVGEDILHPSPEHDLAGRVGFPHVVCHREDRRTTMTSGLN